MKNKIQEEVVDNWTDDSEKIWQYAVAWNDRGLAEMPYPAPPPPV